MSEHSNSFPAIHREPGSTHRISASRLKRFLSNLALIGRAESGGFYREALTDADHKARLKFLKWAKERDFTCSYDPMGNLFIRLPGRDASLSPVMTGSHLDTQPNGGAYDGILGVVAGMEALCAIQEDAVLPTRSIEVAVWTNEEGSRFMPGCMGSRAFVAPALLNDFRNIRDDHGVTVGAELDRLNKDLPAYVMPRSLGGNVHRFIELHIEQGPILEDSKKVLGIVDGIQGFRRYVIKVKGEPAHSGTTPRRLRKDALLCSVDIINRLTDAFKDPADNLRFTVGRILVEPNSPFVVPAVVTFWVDVRHPDRSALENANHILEKVCSQQISPCQVGVELSSAMDPIRFPDHIMASLEAHAGRQSLPWMRISSGAGHDAQMLHTICPSGMIFIPCKAGISHSPKEDINFDHAKAGAQMLAAVLTEWAET